ncbi:MAG: RCC1 domain-containing protein, partial [Parvibaculum sp.]
ESPASVGPVDLGPGRTATAISAGGGHTCAVLDTGQLRCWGFGAFGQLGYADTDNIGDDETPASVAPVDLGPGRMALAISADALHTCAILDSGRLRCWGFG